ncbi:MAG: hypothetical protein COB59_01495 [Rhodospirillaceae bacterium]|nr:MAG: hypothetical protein COB59_01495 [Rhodospirillaceae bacterium]
MLLFNGFYLLVINVMFKTHKKLILLACVAVISVGLQIIPTMVYAAQLEWKSDTFEATYVDSDVKDALRQVLRQNGMQVIFRPGVKGTVDGSFNMPLQGAFNKLVVENALSYEYDDVTNMVTIFSQGTTSVKQDFVTLRNLNIENRVMAAARDLKLERNVRINTNTGIATLKGDAEQIALLRKLLKDLDIAETDRRKYSIANKRSEADMMVARAKAAQAAAEAAQFIDPASLTFQVIPLRYANVGETSRVFHGKTITVPGIEKTLKALMGVAPIANQGEQQVASGPAWGYGIQQIVVDERTNSIIVRGTEEKVAEVKSLIKKLDRSVPMIEIEVLIVRAVAGVSEQLGVNWAAERNLGRQFGGVNTGIASADPTGVTSGLSSAAATSATGLLSTTPESLLAGFVFQGTSFALQTQLSLLESESKTQTIASPTLVTLNNMTARIERSGSEYFVTQNGDNSGTSLTEIQAGLNLDITPSVIFAESSAERELVRMSVTASNTSVNTASAGGSASTSGQQVQTEVIIPINTTFVIGGLVDDSRVDTVRGIPLLKDIPFFGQLFRTDSTADTFTETLFFITPHVVYPEEIVSRDVSQRTYLNDRKTYLGQMRDNLQSKSRVAIAEDE